MSRKPRIHRPGAFYHVMLRGNNGQDIFFSDGDRSRFCLLLQQGIERFKYRIHGFCLMRNHVHLVIQAGALPLSPIMQHLASCYARYINHSQQRIGHLFQGRFRAILVDAESLKELADMLFKDASALSRFATATEQKALVNEELSQIIKQARHQIAGKAERLS